MTNLFPSKADSRRSRFRPNMSSGEIRPQFFSVYRPFYPNLQPNLGAPGVLLLFIGVASPAGTAYNPGVGLLARARFAGMAGIIMSRFINPYSDFGFKKLFGEEASKEFLIDFLNTMLPEKHQIADLTFKDREKLRDVQESRGAYYDIFCTSEKGEEFIVEMQNESIPTFKERSIFYAYMTFRESVRRGVKWKQMKFVPIYVVAIMNYLFESRDHDEPKKLYYSVQFKDQDNDVFYDGITMKFIQMPLFTKSQNQLDNHFEKWLYFLKNLPTMDVIPEIMQEPVFERAFDVAEIANLSPEAYDAYEKSMFDFATDMEIVEYAKQEAQKIGHTIGYDEGRQQGIQQGMQQGMQQIAVNMKKAGESPEKITAYTGLSHDEIERL